VCGWAKSMESLKTKMAGSQNEKLPQVFGNYSRNCGKGDLAKGIIPARNHLAKVGESVCPTAVVPSSSWCELRLVSETRQITGIILADLKYP